MRKTYRLIWTEGPKIKYFIGYGMNSITIFLEDSSNAFTYKDQQEAIFGYNQVRNLMSVNEKKSDADLDAYLHIEDPKGGRSKPSKSSKSNDAYNKAMGVV